MPYTVDIVPWFSIVISKLGFLNVGGGAGVINLSKLISKTYGVACSCTTHSVCFSCIVKGKGWYNLNNISYPLMSLFKATLTAIYCSLLPKFNK